MILLLTCMSDDVPELFLILPTSVQCVNVIEIFAIEDRPPVSPHGHGKVTQWSL